MASRVQLVWHGDNVVERVQQGAASAINTVMAIALGQAQVRAPVDTGHLRGSGFIRPAMLRGGEVVGTWGFSALYTLYVELGTVHMAAQPFIRPAMDVAYPQLPRYLALYTR